MEEKKTLLEQLEEYSRTDAYPFHMPGHKRQTGLGITSFPNPFSVDITEIAGFDNLHHPEGILKESMEHAAAVYGADKTYYLINGSTCGILSALCAAAGNGGRIAMARNSHKSAYHAALCSRLDPIYIWPPIMEKQGISGGIRPEDVEAVLRENGDVKAVFITSPTYEGIVSDVQEIADISHEYGIPLIVDEAHGAHFSFGSPADGLFPKSALKCGADAVIQSLHKTLPALTQTAVLHIKSGLLDKEDAECFLQIFQSSSPSYVLLSSIENCILYMEHEGRNRLAEYGRRMERWMEDMKGLKSLRLLTGEVKGSFGVKDRDLSKIVVFTGDSGLTGIELGELLRSGYRLEPEMVCQKFVLLMTSLMDSSEGLERLKTALYAIDGQIQAEGAFEKNLGGEGEQTAARMWPKNPEKCFKIAEAAEKSREKVLLSAAGGRVSAGFITVYPPGIPSLVPGERFTKEAVELIKRDRLAGLTVEGLDEMDRVWLIKE